MHQLISGHEEIIATLIVAMIYEIIAHIPIQSNSLLQLICSVGYKFFKKCKRKK